MFNKTPIEVKTDTKRNGNMPYTRGICSHKQEEYGALVFGPTMLERVILPKGSVGSEVSLYLARTKYITRIELDGKLNELVHLA